MIRADAHREDTGSEENPMPGTVSDLKVPI